MRETIRANTYQPVRPNPDAMSFNFRKKLTDEEVCGAADRLAEREAEEEVGPPYRVTPGYDKRRDKPAPEPEFSKWPDATQASIQALNDSRWPHGKTYDGWPEAEAARLGIPVGFNGTRIRAGLPELPEPITDSDRLDEIAGLLREIRDRK